MGASGSYVTQDGRLSSVTLTTNPLHQVVARRRQIGGVAELSTFTWTPDGALRSSAGPDGTATLVHDWRDRLVEASTPAAVTAELILDPLGRLVARRTTTPAGTLHRAYLHDGDQVVEEYASAPGPTGVTVAARTLVLRFSEAIHTATMAGLTLTLTPDPGSRTQALDGDGRTLKVTFEQPIPATTPTALHLEGLTDRTGNTIVPFETTFTLADSQAYALLAEDLTSQVEASSGNV